MNCRLLTSTFYILFQKLEYLDANTIYISNLRLLKNVNFIFSFEAKSGQSGNAEFS